MVKNKKVTIKNTNFFHQTPQITIIFTMIFTKVKGRVWSGHEMSCNLNQNMEGETLFLQLIDSNHEKIQLMSKVI